MYNKSFIVWLSSVLFFIVMNIACSDNNPIKPHPPHPPHPEHPIHPRHPDIPSDTVRIVTTDTVFITVVDTVFINVPIIFEIVDLKVEGDVVIDRSGPNIYAVKRNGIEEKRFNLTETSEIPRTVIISHIFKDYKILEDTFSIEVIKGSRAAVKGVRVVEIVYKE